MSVQWFWTSSSPGETSGSPLTSQRTTTGSKNHPRSNSSAQNDGFSEQVFNAEAIKSSENIFSWTTCTRTPTKQSCHRRTFGSMSRITNSFRCRMWRGTTITKPNQKGKKKPPWKRQSPLQKSHKNLKRRKKQLHLGLDQLNGLSNRRKKRPPNLSKLSSEASPSLKLPLRQRKRPHHQKWKHHRGSLVSLGQKRGLQKRL